MEYITAMMRDGLKAWVDKIGKPEFVGGELQLNRDVMCWLVLSLAFGG